MRAGRSMLCSLFVRDFLLLRPPSPHSPKRSEKDVDQKRNRKTPSWCGSRKRKAARTPYDARITEYAHQGHLVPPRSILKTPEQIVGIRESGKINIAVLDHVAAHIKAGMTTAEIDRLVFEKTRELGGVPAPLGYRGFPKSTCTSINEEVCHGIPADDVALNSALVRAGRNAAYWRSEEPVESDLGAAEDPGGDEGKTDGGAASEGATSSSSGTPEPNEIVRGI